MEQNIESNLDLQSESQNQKIEKTKNPVQTQPAKGDDDQARKIKEVRKKISSISGDDQSQQQTQKQSVEIKSMEDLLAIQDTGAKLESLYQYAIKDEDNKKRALEWAKEIWEETENAYLLDVLHDKLAVKPHP